MENRPTPNTLTETATPQLARKFGVWMGVFAVFASMVGSGIITTTGFVVNATGSHGINLILWCLGGVLALCGALTMAEMATAHPKAGGDYIYVREAYGGSWAFVYGWAMVVIGFAAPTASVAMSTANYLFNPVQSVLAGTSLQWILGTSVDVSQAACTNATFNAIAGTILIAFFTFTHCLGQQGSSIAQSLSSLFDILILAAMALVLFAFGMGSADNLISSSPAAVSRDSQGNVFPFAYLGMLGSQLVWVMYAYTGWNGAVYLAGEFRDPPRMLPRALVFGCLTVTTLYLIINVGYGYALSVHDIRSMSDESRQRIAASALEHACSKRTADVFSLIIGVGRIAAISVFILTGARVIYAMALDKLMFPALAQLDARRGVPSLATIFLGLLSIAFLWSGTFDQILDFTAYGLGMMSLLVVTPIFALRRRSDFNPTFRTPLYPLPPILFIGVNAAMLVAGGIDKPWPAAYNLTLFAAAFGIYFAIVLMRRSTSRSG